MQEQSCKLSCRCTAATSGKSTAILTVCTFRWMMCIVQRSASPISAKCDVITEAAHNTSFVHRAPVVTGFQTCVVLCRYEKGNMTYIPSARGIWFVHAALPQQLHHAVHISQVVDDLIHPVISQGRPPGDATLPLSPTSEHHYKETNADFLLSCRCAARC